MRGLRPFYEAVRAQTGDHEEFIQEMQYDLAHGNNGDPKNAISWTDQLFRRER